MDDLEWEDAGEGDWDVSLVGNDLAEGSNIDGIRIEIVTGGAPSAFSCDPCPHRVKGLH